MSADNFTYQRDRDILKAYEKAIKHYGHNAKYLTRDELIKKAMEFSAPRFYISYEVARRNISTLLNKKLVNVKNNLRLNMYFEILKRFEERKNDNSYSELERIINSEAPSFYLSKARFSRIINKQIKNIKQCQ